jgi:transcriptional regulator with XRE-family HTH domain
MRTLGEALRLLRIHHDLRQNQAAAASGLSTSYVSEIERGLKTPTLEAVARLAALYDLPRSAVFYLAEVVALPPGTPRPPMPDARTSAMIAMHLARGA